MSKRKSKKKQHSRNVLILYALSALLLLALLLVVPAYLRTRRAEKPRDAAPSAAAAEESSLSESAPEARAETPKGPLQLQLDILTSMERLDIVVCDEAGSAVPGYAFALELTRDDGSSHSVATDVNGRYYAEYIVGGSYTVTLTAPEGFLAPPSRTVSVPERLDYVAIENLEERVEISDVSDLPENEVHSGSVSDTPAEVEELDSSALDQPQTPQKSYLYHYAVDADGYLLKADGSSSDLLPVEENGTLAYGMRRVTRYYANDGTLLDPAQIPESAVIWTDYYVDEYAEKVPLITAPGVADSAYAITVEEGTPENPIRRVGWVEEYGKTYYYNASGRPVTGLKNIDGKLYYFDNTGAKAGSLGIDVSYFNSSIDWNAVKAAGVDFAIVRVAGRTWSKGILFEDEYAYRQGKNGGFYLQGAKAAGLKVGAYVYSNAIDTNEAVEEASLALEVLQKSGVALDMPIYFDLEHSGEYPTGRADRLSADKRAEIVKAFCETIENSGYRAGVYASEWFFTRSLRVEDVEPYDLWYAVYTRDFAMPEFRDFDIWQFSETVRVNGMPDFTDMNVIFQAA